MESQNKIYEEIKFLRKELIDVMDNQVYLIDIGFD
jgi:hypothetical protein